jgi:hypothetical protein
LNKAGISVSASLSVFFEQTPVANWDKVRSEGGSGGFARTWMQAAMHSERILSVNGSPPVVTTV